MHKHSFFWPECLASYIKRLLSAFLVPRTGNTELIMAWSLLSWGTQNRRPSDLLRWLHHDPVFLRKRPSCCFPPQFSADLQGLNEHLLPVRHGLRPAEAAERNGTLSVLRSHLVRVGYGDVGCVQDKYPQNFTSEQNIVLLLLSHVLKNKTK